jgi:hypothetical protein
MRRGAPARHKLRRCHRRIPLGDPARPDRTPARLRPDRVRREWREFATASGYCGILLIIVILSLLIFGSFAC